MSKRIMGFVKDYWLIGAIVGGCWVVIISLTNWSGFNIGSTVELLTSLRFWKRFVGGLFIMAIALGILWALQKGGHFLRKKDGDDATS